jgi:hypothetical protein
VSPFSKADEHPFSSGRPHQLQAPSCQGLPRTRRSLRKSSSIKHGSQSGHRSHQAHRVATVASSSQAPTAFPTWPGYATPS